ncbi:hypothetical protein [Streptomyces aurantiogriseus]|uniref:Uncharacterized protein n=1 Tax=Streptomyces aurantiogriseus TaxID=66870 RepID=A0A918C6H5_9ACTN|nr:hypothetical protein [Streptomyces aurantiogriseus]GGR07415.1 hypothetical protein GCM10010251_24170 [Streptomyces aurantiogriseus]
MTWSEAEYAECLEGERRRYAWVMRRYGGLSPTESWTAALRCYPYEPPDKPYRGLVFHDEAWHWAMRAVHGDRYVLDRPELVDPPAEYRALD